MDNFDIGWAAGLFEGEGTIVIRGPRQLRASPYRTVGLQLSSTDEDVVRRFCAIVQRGAVYGPYGPYQQNRQLFWKWNADGEDAAAVLTLILSGLGNRRSVRAKDAMEVIRHRASMPCYSVSRKGMGGRPRTRTQKTPSAAA